MIARFIRWFKKLLGVREEPKEVTVMPSQSKCAIRTHDAEGEPLKSARCGKCGQFRKAPCE